MRPLRRPRRPRPQPRRLRPLRTRQRRMRPRRMRRPPIPRSRIEPEEASAMTRGFSFLFLGAAIGAMAIFAGGAVGAAVTVSGADGLALFRQVFETARDVD